jgi:hypothetical protein
MYHNKPISEIKRARLFLCDSDHIIKVVGCVRLKLRLLGEIRETQNAKLKSWPLRAGIFFGRSLRTPATLSAYYSLCYSRPTEMQEPAST